MFTLQRSHQIMVHLQTVSILQSPLTMRLLRKQHSANKENRRGPLQQENSSLQLGLKEQATQIEVLRTSNWELLRRAEKAEQKAASYGQELQFLREQDKNIRQQLLNYEQLNAKLRQQLDNCRKVNQKLEARLNGYSQQVRRELLQQNVSRDKKAVFEQRRSWLSSRSSIPSSPKSSMVQSARDNHGSTPKSKLHINWDQLVPANIPERRKVFF